MGNIYSVNLCNQHKLPEEVPLTMWLQLMGCQTVEASWDMWFLWESNSLLFACKEGVLISHTQRCPHSTKEESN